MKNKISHQAAIVATSALICMAGEPLTIPWHTIDGGGILHSTSADGVFELSGTIGQPDAGVMTGADFKLTGGFWFETPPGDCNANGIRDIADHAGFAACLAGPTVNVAGECVCFDTNKDRNVDLLDLAEAQVNFAK